TGGEEDAVAWLGAGVLSESRALVLTEVTGDRSAELAVLTNEDVGQTLGAMRAGPLLPGIQLLAALAGAAGHDHRAHVPVGLASVAGRAEDPELGVGDVLGEVHELAAEAEVGSVRAEPTHRLGIGHPPDRSRDLVPQDVLPDPAQHLLGEGHHVVGGT